MLFEWDGEQSRTNHAKHGVGFEAAVLVFNDPEVVFVVAERFDYDEPRWIALGRIEHVVLYVAHTVSEDENGEEIVRVISARKTTPFEERIYLTR